MSAKKKGHLEAGSYANFIRSLDLYGLSLAESRFKCDRERYLSERSHEIAFTWKAKRTPLSGNRKDKRAFNLWAELRLVVTAPKSDEAFFVLSAGFLLHIHSEVIEAEHIERFCNSEVRILVWPYFREYVSNVCGRAHIPPITLPLTGRAR
jgi:hypothetical protein